MKRPTQTSSSLRRPREALQSAQSAEFNQGISALGRQFIKSHRLKMYFWLFFPFFKEDSLTLSRVLEFIFNVFYAVSQFRVFHYTKRLLKSYEFGMFSSICCLKTQSAIQSHLCGGAEWEMQMLPQSNGSLHVCWTAAGIWQDVPDFREPGFETLISCVCVMIWVGQAAETTQLPK